MKVLITGSSGQLGRALMRAKPQGCEATACDRTRLDLADREQVLSRVREIRPDIILNAAAYTAVDKAENDVASAHAINSRGVAYLVEAASEVGAKIVHVSTDFVFGGDKCKPYLPDAARGPLGVYGQSKLEGEKELRASDLLVRTAWVYDADGANFLNTMLRLFNEREYVSVVSDQIGTPTFAKDLAAAIWQLVDANAAGAYHFTNSGVASWYDFAVAIREEATNCGLLDATVAIAPILSQDYPTPAKRPHYSVLNCFHTYERLGSVARHWRAALRDALREKI